MNIWHDIDPKMITATDFSAVIEIPRGCSFCAWTVFFIPPRTIPQTTALFPAPLPTTATRWTCWYSAPSLSSP